MVFDIMIRGIQKDYHANRHQYEGDEVFEISIEIHDEITDFLQKFWEKAQEGNYSVCRHNNLSHRGLTHNVRHTEQQKTNTNQQAAHKSLGEISSIENLP